MRCIICGAEMTQMSGIRHYNIYWCARCDRDVKEEKPSWRTILFPEAPEVPEDDVS